MRKGKNRVCSICGKLIRPGGMGGHVRLAHGITVIVKHVRDIRGDVPADVRDMRGDVPADVRDVRVQRPSDNVKKSNEMVETCIEPGGFTVPTPIIQNISNVVGKDLSECKRPDGKHFYTDTDLRILTRRLINQTYNPGSEVALFNQFTFMDLIADFERRFECRFDDVRKANNHGKISVDLGTTFEEHWLFANKYSSLKYSR
ncbi:MAG: hypothetical protein Q8N38_10925 [Bacteroidales bacterium]|nr:hypothetical protein [Bacteroidales bacterium]